MSRAFVKESDGDELLATRARRQHSDLPNDVKPAGLHAMRSRLTGLARERAARVDDTAAVDAKAALALEIMAVRNEHDRGDRE